MVGNVAHPRQRQLFELRGVDFIAGSESSEGGQGLIGIFHEDCSPVAILEVDRLHMMTKNTCVINGWWLAAGRLGSRGSSGTRLL